MNQLKMFFHNADIRVITVDDSDEIVPAEIIGQVAVHQSLERAGCWTITHVLSGYGVLTVINEYWVALGIAQRLIALDLDGYWNKGCCAPRSFYDAANRIIADYVNEHGLSFGYRVSGKLCEVEA